MSVPRVLINTSMTCKGALTSPLPAQSHQTDSLHLIRGRLKPSVQHFSALIAQAQAGVCALCAYWRLGATTGERDLLLHPLKAPRSFSCYGAARNYETRNRQHWVILRPPTGDSPGLPGVPARFLRVGAQPDAWGAVGTGRDPGRAPHSLCCPGGVCEGRAGGIYLSIMRSSGGGASPFGGSQAAGKSPLCTPARSAVQ
ncbi:hypothetical protein NDU88_004984 [Pleurodeles waltl]|uniref:Uncharacterized protein n=1 Tax=Pleurodeles waltl TaxID=8319 RepID=A0AAV7UHM3_PLEWA|nr:hypothetical protein NDU88_004984 [Pleurodeles waltl]